MRLLSRLVVGVGAAAALLAACQEGEGSGPSAASAPAEAKPLAGAYEVAGTTVDEATGSERGLSGRLIVTTRGDTYSVSFDLTTTLVGSGEPQRAQVIGTGDGTIEERTLTGTADTQLIVALVPGVDAGFGMMPRGITTRIRNRSVATIAPDGSVEIEIESDPAPGETDYAPTRTTLRGRRLAAAGIGGPE
jgi:hypothetical protein